MQRKSIASVAVVILLLLIAVGFSSPTPVVATDTAGGPQGTGWSLADAPVKSPLESNLARSRSIARQ